MPFEHIQTIDLHFQGKPMAIASYLLKHRDGIALVESGPGSSLVSLKAGLANLGYSLTDITHVLLTHIHLDHAGAAGELSTYGAQILVHPVGAPHMIDPSKLIASATRIYAERMDSLWGQFLPVHEQNLRILGDGEEFEIGGLEFKAIFTPGHAEHHICYLHDDLCFTGDIGGIRIPGYQYLRLPMPPPELNLEKWKHSIQLLRKEKIVAMAPTHFGIFSDVEWQLAALENTIPRIEAWMDKNLGGAQVVDELKVKFQHWMNEQASEQGLTPEVIEAFALSNPVGMSVDGMLRYWNKVIHPPV